MNLSSNAKSINKTKDFVQKENIVLTAGQKDGDPVFITIPQVNFEKSYVKILDYRALDSTDDVVDEHNLPKGYLEFVNSTTLKFSDAGNVFVDRAYIIFRVKEYA